MIYYLTFNDAPSGIYSSQIIDVVKFLNTEIKSSVKLVAFISIRDFFNNRKRIKSECIDAIVLPMFPKLANWKKNQFLLNTICKIYKPNIVIGRSVLATQLALAAKRKKLIPKVVYDGRGAIEAEWNEYNVITEDLLLKNSYNIECECIHQSDYRIAVSNQLVKHWREKFNYSSNEHVVIPCTINKVFEDVIINEENVSKSRELLKLNKDDKVFIYSGSVAGWQSFDLLYNFIVPILNSDKNFKLFFLSDTDKNIQQLKNEYPNQVVQKKVLPSEVPNYLMSADYGLLIREETVTNNVASPVKFAEYLSCGLKVIISNNLGDYTNFVRNNNAGELYTTVANLLAVSLNEKIRLQQLALHTFSKSSYKTAYQQVIRFV